jgi:hypothetical protein
MVLQYTDRGTIEVNESSGVNGAAYYGTSFLIECKNYGAGFPQVVTNFNSSSNFVRENRGSGLTVTTHYSLHMAFARFHSNRQTAPLLILTSTRQDDTFTCVELVNNTTGSDQMIVAGCSCKLQRSLFARIQRTGSNPLVGGVENGGTVTFIHCVFDTDVGLSGSNAGFSTTMCTVRSPDEATIDQEICWPATPRPTSSRSTVPQSPTDICPSQCDSSNRVDLHDTIWEGCSIEADGGAIYIDHSQVYFTLSRCPFLRCRVLNAHAGGCVVFQGKSARVVSFEGYLCCADTSAFFVLKIGSSETGFLEVNESSGVRGSSHQSISPRLTRELIREDILK